MDICKSNRAVSLEVLKFMQFVSDLKEETITDYLAWKWRELDKRFNYLSMQTFSHKEENSTTGADFDLELWLVGGTTHVSLAVQAKKFIKQHGSYIKLLKYPKGTKQQMNTLLAYAAANNKLPFYFIYSIPGPGTSTMCRQQNGSDCGVFMADAKIIEEFADGKHGKRASRDNLLSHSNPFYCMFCCPLGSGTNFFDAYFPTVGQGSVSRSNDALPQYVRNLLKDGEARQERGTQDQPTSNEGWSRFRAVGVYDLRGRVTSYVRK